MKYCSKCGAPNPDENQVCENCKKPFDVEKFQENQRESKTEIFQTKGANQPISQKKGVKWRLIVPLSVIAILIVVVGVLIGTHVICIKHDYIPATCTQPMMCKYCGKTTGVIKGHEEGNWVITKEASYSEYGEEVCCCIECDEVLEIKYFDLSTYIEDDKFIFTPNEFTDKLNYYLYDAEGSYGAYIGVREEDNVVASCIYRNAEDSGVCQISFIDGEDYFTGEAGREESGADTIAVFFNKSCDNVELELLLPSIVQSLNPYQSVADVIDICDSIIEEAEYGGVVDNGIMYRLVDVEGIFDDSKWWLIIMVDE